MFADPDVPIDSQYHVDLSPTMNRIDRPYLSPSSNHTTSTARTTDTHENPISQLPVLQTPRVQTGTSILMQALYLRYQKIALAEESPDL